MRPADRDDVRALVDVLARVFDDDPPFRWALPDDGSRPAPLRRLFAPVLRTEALPQEAVDAARDAQTGRIVGAAIWFPPGTWPRPVLRQLVSLPGYVRALGWRFGPASSLAGALARVHPRAPHWYPYAVGVDPAHQGRGVGNQSAAAYLECSKPANVPLYEHFGFQPGAVSALPDGAPVLTPMSRPAR